MKIIIKLPDNRVKKFRIQVFGYKSRRFLRGTSLLNALENGFLREKKDKLTSVVVKEYKGKGFKEINETVASRDNNYLFLTTLCFLEDFVTKGYFNSKSKEYSPKVQSS